MTTTVIDRVVGALGDGRLHVASLERSRQRIARLRRSPALPATRAAGAAHSVAERAIVVDGLLPNGPFAVLECRPPGSMACFNVAWGVARELSERGWPVATIDQTHPIAPAVDALLNRSGERPVLIVVRDTCVHRWQTAVIDAVVHARPTAVVVELGWPDQCSPSGAASVVTHGAARCSANAVIDRLSRTGKES
jgi:beta-N-acetylhexosaminidase